MKWLIIGRHIALVPAASDRHGCSITASLVTGREKGFSMQAALADFPAQPGGLIWFLPTVKVSVVLPHRESQTLLLLK